MSKTRKYICAALLVFLTLALTVYAFDWPLEGVSPSNIYMYFGQKRSESFSPSIIFAESGSTKACEAGRVTVILTEAPEDGDWFESTLGNAVVISHEGAFSTVYANLDADTFSPTILASPKVNAGASIAAAGNSGWQDGQSYLEFQVLDNETKSFLNPLILMPRFSKQIEISLSGIILENKLGKRYEVSSTSSLPAGAYNLYRKRQTAAMPYKTAVYVNGAESELITYDTLKQNNSRLCAVRNTKENKYYNSQDIYPDDSLMRIGTVFLPHGKNTISVIVTDFLGKEKTARFSVNTF